MGDVLRRLQPQTASGWRSVGSSGSIGVAGGGNNGKTKKRHVREVAVIDLGGINEQLLVGDHARREWNTRCARHPVSMAFARRLGEVSPLPTRLGPLVGVGMPHEVEHLPKPKAGAIQKDEGLIVGATNHRIIDGRSPTLEGL